MIWLGIIGIIIAVCIIAFFIWIDDESAPYMMVGAICFLLLFGSWFVIVNNLAPTPTSLDVYRDKTTLEITYRDSVAIDSVVVYKMK